MDNQEKDFAIQQISQGKYFIEYNDSTYVFHEPNSSMRLQGVFLYKVFHKESIEMGFLDEEAEKALLIEEGLWSKKDEEILDIMVKDIHKLQRGKPALKFKSRQLAQVDATIDKLNKEISRFMVRKNSFYLQTAKYRAARLMYEWYIFQGMHDLEGNRLWPTKDDFERDFNDRRINSFVNTIFFKQLFDEKGIRELSRSEPWRTYWKASCQASDPLFDIPSTQYNLYQKSMCYWSLLYDNIFEHPESPTQEVINDDALLDDWLLEQYNKRQKETSTDSSFIKNEKIRNSQEIFLAVDTQEDADKVYNQLNSPEAKRTMAMRRDALNKKGRIKESELPDVKKKLTMEMNALIKSKGKSK